MTMLKDDSRANQDFIVCVCVCVCVWGAGMRHDGIWVQQGNTNIREMDPSGGVEEAVREPSL